MLRRCSIGLALGASVFAVVGACSLPATIGDDDPAAGTSDAGSGIGTAPSAEGTTDTSGDDPAASGAVVENTGSGSGSGSGATTEPGDAGATASGSTTATTGDEICVAPMEVPCDQFDADPLHAIGLGCPGATAAGSVVVEDVANVALATAWQYGAWWTPVEGERLVTLTTGVLVPGPAPQSVYEAGFGEGGNANPDNVHLPAPIVRAAGSNAGAGGTPFEGCDGVGDCSDSLSSWTALANDLVVLRFEVEVPDDVAGFRVDFTFLTDEYPEWLYSQFRDLLVVWVEGDVFTGNVCSVGSLPLPCIPDAFAPVMEDTGPGTVGGGATGWRTLRAPVAPGETIEVTVALSDIGGPASNSAALFDRWRWDCGDCRDDIAAPCGVNPQLAL